MANFNNAAYKKLGGLSTGTITIHKLTASLWCHRQAFLLLAPLWLVTSAFVAVGYANMRLSKAMKFHNQLLYCK